MYFQHHYLFLIFEYAKMGTVLNNNSKHTHVHIQGSFWWCAKHHGATLNKLRNLVLEMKN